MGLSRTFESALNSSGSVFQHPWVMIFIWNTSLFLDCISIYYFRYLFCSCLGPSLCRVSVCLICSWPPPAECSHTLKNPMDLKLLLDCNIHLFSCNSKSLLQVFLIMIRAVDCDCNTATPCQPNQSTYPSSRSILHVETTTHFPPAAAVLFHVVLSTSQLFQFWHQIQKRV